MGHYGLNHAIAILLAQEAAMLKVREKLMECDAIHWTGEDYDGMKEFVRGAEHFRCRRSEEGGVIIERTRKPQALKHCPLGAYVLRTQLGKLIVCSAEEFELGFDIIEEGRDDGIVSSDLGGPDPLREARAGDAGEGVPAMGPDREDEAGIGRPADDADDSGARDP